MGIIGRISCFIATLGPIGYLPAPGTWGTLCAAILMYGLRAVVAVPMLMILVAVSGVIAYNAVRVALLSFSGQHDPAQIVIDEFIGFSALSCAIPLQPILFIAGFFLFRFFDIIKPLGIRSIEHLDGSLGIMLDDLIAALYAGLCMWVIIVALNYTQI